jgi:hypothetical protein
MEGFQKNTRRPLENTLIGYYSHYQQPWTAVLRLPLAGEFDQRNEKVRGETDERQEACGCVGGEHSEVQGHPLVPRDRSAKRPMDESW